MADRTRTLLLFIALAMLVQGRGVLALDISVGLAVPLAGQSSRFEANRAASQETGRQQWFEESTQSETMPNLRLQLGLSDQSGLRFELSQISGQHHGKVGQYECLFFGCAWVSSKVVTGIDASESVSWQFTRLASRYEHDLPTIPALRIRLHAGLDLIYAKMAAQAANETFPVQGIIPVPGMGFSIRAPLNERWAIEGHHDRSALHVAGSRLDMAETRIELQYQWSPAITAALGYRLHRFDLDYVRGDTHAALAIKLKTPYLLATYSF